MDFAARLKQLRKENDMTQDDLGAKLNTTRSTIAGYEARGKEPKYETLVKLANIFSISVDYLLGISDIRSTNEKLVSSAFHIEGTDALSDEDIEAVNSIIKHLVEKNSPTK